MVNLLSLRWIPLVAAVSLLAGCSWFTWLPWVDDDDDREADEPAKLVKFDAEIQLNRVWRSSIGKGLRKNICAYSRRSLRKELLPQMDMAPSRRATDLVESVSGKFRRMSWMPVFLTR